MGAFMAPPIGGALYKRMGWHAPFIFLIIVLSVDTIARLFIIEVKDVKRLRARQAAAARVLAAEGHPEEAAALERITTGPKTEAEKQIAGLEEKAEEDEKIVELSAWGVLKALISLPRGVVAFFQFFVFGFIIGAFDATLAIRVESVWGKDADFVGLIYLAGGVPSFFIGPLAGWASDKIGTEWVAGAILLFCAPWVPLLTLTSSLPAFIVFFACANTVASLEVAIVSKFRPGISEIHEFAAMNLAFAISSAVGAVVGGQILNNVKNGWNVICWIGFALFIMIFLPTLLFTGKWPLLWRALRRPGPRSGVHPDELAKMDAEKAGRDAAAAEGRAGLTREGSKSATVGEEMDVKSSGGEFGAMGGEKLDRPPTLPALELGHGTSLSPK